MENLQYWSPALAYRQGRIHTGINGLTEWPVLEVMRMAHAKSRYMLRLY